MSLAVNCSVCGDSILVENATYRGEKAYCKEHSDSQRKVEDQ